MAGFFLKNDFPEPLFAFFPRNRPMLPNAVRKNRIRKHMLSGTEGSRIIFSGKDQKDMVNCVQVFNSGGRSYADE